MRRRSGLLRQTGGLAEAPTRYLEDLRGAKRHYAELYGVQLSEPATPDDGESAELEVPALLGVQAGAAVR